MGIFGFVSTVTNFRIEDTPFVLSNCVDSLHGSVGSTYAYIEDCLSYDLQFMYVMRLSTLSGDSFSHYFYFYWFIFKSAACFTLVYAVILDIMVNNLGLTSDFFEDWFRNIITAPEVSCFVLDHPEIAIIRIPFLDDLATSKFYLTMCENLDKECWYLPVLVTINLLILVYIMFTVVILYLSFFGSNTKEENNSDNDFFLSNVGVESEKETGSFDDIILTLIFLLYIFGWFFYVYIWALVSQIPELTLFFFLFPLFYYLILLIPCYLLYDFGIHFLAYLSGSGKGSFLVGEIFSDTVAFTVFYIRKLIHAVRLAIVIGVIFELQEFVMLYSFDQYFFTGDESIFDSIGNDTLTITGSSYFLFMILPSYIFHWIFELLHTIVYVTVQSFAFFAMVFWLYFYFYTFFVFEKYENYFQKKRKDKNKKLKNLFSSHDKNKNS